MSPYLTWQDSNGVKKRAKRYGLESQHLPLTSHKTLTKSLNPGCLNLSNAKMGRQYLTPKSATLDHTRCHPQSLSVDSHKM